MFEWLNSSSETNYVYQTTLWPNMWKHYTDFPLVHFSGIFCVKAVCTADVIKSEMLIQVQESIWYEKKTPVAAYCIGAQQYIHPMCKCLLCFSRMSLHFTQKFTSKNILRQINNFLNNLFLPFGNLTRVYSQTSRLSSMLPCWHSAGIIG